MLHLQNLFAASRPAHGGMQQDQRAHVLRPVLKEALPRPPPPPLGQQSPLPGMQQLGQGGASLLIPLLPHDGPDGHRDDAVCAVGSVAAAAGAWDPRLGPAQAKVLSLL